LGTQITLTASDGFKLGGYRAEPQGKPKGGLVVIQEIFGVNHHIRALCDRFAALGYLAVAPAVFDRIQPNFECGYTPDEIANARKFVANPNWDAMLKDTQAAIDQLKKEGPVAIIGFCLGGSVAFLAATRLSGLSAAVAYYGGAIAKFADEKPKVPVQMHFGEKDQGISMADVAAIKSKRPESEIHTYADASHGFHCDERASYNDAAAKTAWPRSMEFLKKNVRK
jgi:carboxymethylenebutenolidase